MSLTCVSCIPNTANRYRDYDDYESTYGDEYVEEVAVPATTDNPLFWEYAQTINSLLDQMEAYAAGDYSIDIESVTQEYDNTCDLINAQFDESDYDQNQAVDAINGRFERWRSIMEQNMSVTEAAGDSTAYDYSEYYY